ncbi:MAG TPA: hypothetical protein VKA46_27140 [Gemmataceae bacterium]|nr:hypothetical protein [Gemmataceae bacterium]
MSSNPTDSGVRGTIDPIGDDIIFREFRLRGWNIDACKPFNQAQSDAHHPIRIVVDHDGKKYVLQGNHRVAGAQEDGLRSIDGILYTPKQWEDFTGLSFIPGGTNNPIIE